MTAERAQPSDLDHAQRRMAGLEEQLRATLEDAFRLSSAGEFDAALLRLDEQSRDLDIAMDALARDITGISLVPTPARDHRRRVVARLLAAAVAITAVLASGFALLRHDPLSQLASKIERVDSTADPQVRLELLEDAYASLKSAPADVVASSTVGRDLAESARKTQKDLEDADAPQPMSQRAAIIARDLDPRAPVAPQSGAGSPTEVITSRFPRR